MWFEIGLEVRLSLAMHMDYLVVAGNSLGCSRESNCSKVNLRVVAVNQYPNLDTIR